MTDMRENSQSGLFDDETSKELVIGQQFELFEPEEIVRPDLQI